MKKYNRYLTAIFAASTMLFTACSDNSPEPEPSTTDRYVLITLADRVSGTKAGFISTFDEFPTGTISNATTGSLEGQGMGGWRTHGDNIYKMFRYRENQHRREWYGYRRCFPCFKGCSSIGKIFRNRQLCHQGRQPRLLLGCSRAYQNPKIQPHNHG